MPKSAPVKVDQLLVITPSKGVTVNAMQSKLKAFARSDFVVSMGRVNVAHVDKLAKQAVTLFDPKAILQLLSGASNMKKGTGIGSLVGEMKLAEQALDTALASSSRSLKKVQAMNDYIDGVNRRAREALKESAKIR